VLRGVVYDVTRYMDYHPGGAEELMRGAGEDATSLFAEAHPWVNFESMLTSCVVGRIGAAKSKLARPVSTPASASGAALLQGDGKWHSVRLVASEIASADRECMLYRFALPAGTASLGLDTAGQHLEVKFIDSGKPDREDGFTTMGTGGGIAGATREVIRQYTPVPLIATGTSSTESSPMAASGGGGRSDDKPKASAEDSKKPLFELAVKLYEHGRASAFFRKLTIGQDVLIRGPRGGFSYRCGIARWGGKDHKANPILLAGGGSGVTPMMQIAAAAASDPSDSTPIHLLVVCTSEENIMLRNRLDALHSGRSNTTVTYLITRMKDGSRATNDEPESAIATAATDSTKPAVFHGHISPTTLKSIWPAPTENAVIATCGPDGFNRAVEDSARELYYKADNIFIF